MNLRDMTPEARAELFRQVFEVDKRGEALLEYMSVLFTQPAATTGGIDAVLKTYQRLGQNSVIQYINAQINKANNLPSNPEDYTQ